MLKRCLKETECWKKGGKSMSDCAKEGHCEEYVNGYKLCRMQQLDMRSRIQGNKGGGT